MFEESWVQRVLVGAGREGGPPCMIWANARRIHRALCKTDGGEEIEQRPTVSLRWSY